MNYKGRRLEKALIDYLYGEMSAGERKKIEKFLEEDDSARKKLEELRSVREIMGKLPDREVIEPVVLMGNPASSGVKRILKPVMGIAAAILLLVISGYIFNASITYTRGMLSLTFGSEEVEETAQYSDPEITAMVNEAIQKNNHAILDRLNSLEEEVDNRQRDISEVSSEQARSITSTERKEIKSMLEEFQHENYILIQDMINASSVEQQKYMEELLISFSDHLEKQRREDLKMINEGFMALKNETDRKYNLAEDLLADVMYEFTNSK